MIIEANTDNKVECPKAACLVPVKECVHCSSKVEVPTCVCHCSFEQQLEIALKGEIIQQVLESLQIEVVQEGNPYRFRMTITAGETPLAVMEQIHCEAGKPLDPEVVARQVFFGLKWLFERANKVDNPTLSPAKPDPPE